MFILQPDQAVQGEEMLATAALFVKLDSAKNLPVSKWFLMGILKGILNWNLCTIWKRCHFFLRGLGKLEILFCVTGKKEQYSYVGSHMEKNLTVFNFAYVDIFIEWVCWFMLFCYCVGHKCCSWYNKCILQTYCWKCHSAEQGINHYCYFICMSWNSLQLIIKE